MGRTAERIARNDAIFRSANEGIREAVERYGGPERVPFVCECADEECRELLRLTLDEYAAIRQNPRWFLNAIGHDSAAGQWGTVVERHDDYVVVEKLGEAGEIVERLEGSEHPESAPVDSAPVEGSH